MDPEREPVSMRDDAQLQPESGYPNGRVSTKPSAHPDPNSVTDDSAIREGSGSEAEFGKLKGEC